MTETLATLTVSTVNSLVRWLRMKQAEGVGKVADRLVRVARLCERYTETLTGDATKGSERRSERAVARSTPGGGGVARAEILDMLLGEASITLTHVTTMLRGFATHVADAEASGTFNQTASAVIIRSQLETAGFLHWLFEPALGAEERCRRYLRWRLADLGEITSAIRSSPVAAEPGVARAAAAHLDAQRSSLVDLATRACFDTGETKRSKALTLLDAAGIAEVLPSRTRLVDGLGVAGTYSMLSTAAHGSRWDRMARLTGLETADGVTKAQVRPSGLPNRLTIQLAVLGAGAPCARIEQWHRGEVHDPAFKKLRIAVQKATPR